MGGIWDFWSGLGGNFWLKFSKGGSEKGSTRKHTGNWVTRWGFIFLEEFSGFTLNCEENKTGGI
jgi:hypothetical protein